MHEIVGRFRFVSETMLNYSWKLIKLLRRNSSLVWVATRSLLISRPHFKFSQLYLFAICLLFALGVAARPSYFLMNAATGEKIIAENSDVRRFPASLTKLMTLYVVFDHLKAGTLDLMDEVPMSTQACRMPSSKLYLRPGTKMTVEEAIKALVVKSANDVAFALAERVGGSDYEFVALMNQKAAELGMKDTIFYNPSGLPHRQQVSTAEDMAVLARAHLDNHSEFYHFFAERQFYFRGKRYKSTNRLLGKIEGLDGLKTGYTRAAGYNLVASQKIGPERIIGVVMGESSPIIRDQRMVELLNKQVPTTEQVLEAERTLSRKRRKTRLQIYQWTVHAGTFRNRKQANKFMQDLKKNQPSFLSKVSNKLLNVVRRKRKHYTTQVGRFQSRQEAEGLCSALKEKSLSCSVVKTK